MTDRNDMIDVLAYWQNRLRLQDWNIDLRSNTPADDMPCKNVYGDVEYVESTKRATVYLVNPLTLGDEERQHYDRTQTLVHELLHLKLCLLDDVSPLQDRVLHQLIDDLAKGYAEVKGGQNE